MTSESDRPQDVGRQHRRKPAQGSVDRALVERYQATMREELARLLDDLAPVPQPDGLHGPVPAKRPDLATRSRVWDLAIKLGRELGTAIDPDPSPAGAPLPARRRKPGGRVDYG
jgi:hypothetical protein